MTPAEFDALPAEAFLEPERFVTSFDALHRNTDYCRRQYRDGVRVGQSALYVSVSVNGVWSAQLRDGGHLESFERLGHHACTADLLRGLLDSDVPIRVYRRGRGWTWIKGEQSALTEVV